MLGPHLAAKVAEGAVVDVAPRLVVKEVADGAVVPRHAGAAGGAGACTHVGQRQSGPGRCRLRGSWLDCTQPPDAAVHVLI